MWRTGRGHGRRVDRGRGEGDCARSKRGDRGGAHGEEEMRGLPRDDSRSTHREWR